MRKIATALIVLATAAQAAGAVVAPTLRIVTTDPLVVRGAHFRAAERVTVKGPSVTRVVHTTASGTFRANLGVVPTDRCSMPMRIVATGALGDKAVFLPARAMCAPASTG
jgi:hypothetical protein